MLINSDSTIRPVMKMTTVPAKLEISQPHGELKIDQSPCRESLGLKSNVSFSQENFDYGKQSVNKFIQQTVADGDMAYHIENKQNSFAQSVASNALQQPYDIVWATKNPPIIRYNARQVEFNVQPGRIDISV